MFNRKITDKLPFLSGKIFTNTNPSSAKYRTTGNTYVCILPIKVNENNSSLRVNGETHFLKIGEPLYLGPTDVYEFCGPCTVSLTFCSPTNSVGEEQIVE